MITSPDNERARFVRSLYAKKTRYQERAFVVEGVRLMEEVLEAGATPKSVFYEPETLGRTKRGSILLDRLGPDAVPVTERVLRSISDTAAPQGIVAIVPFPEEPVKAEGALVLVLDGMRDPGNLGTILRTALAAEVGSIICTADTADPFGPKVVRAGMGAHFRLSLFVDKSWEDIGRLAEQRAVLIAAVSGGRPYYEVNWTKPSALVVGSEAHGAGEEARRMATDQVTIPMAPGVESLNAAVATGVMLFEAYRQRTNRITAKG